MPTYEYACKSCGEHLEVVQSFRDGPLTECPACGGALRKVFGNIGIAFKGSGFYKTDSRSEAKKRTSGGAGEAAASPAKKESAGGEAASSSGPAAKEAGAGSSSGSTSATSSAKVAAAS
jgi:putative FmdB family regulatory protein